MRRLRRPLEVLELLLVFSLRRMQVAVVFTKRLCTGKSNLVDRRVQNREFYVGLIQLFLDLLQLLRGCTLIHIAALAMERHVANLSPTKPILGEEVGQCLL